MSHHHNKSDQLLSGTNMYHIYCRTISIEIVIMTMTTPTTNSSHRAVQRSWDRKKIFRPRLSGKSFDIVSYMRLPNKSISNGVISGSWKVRRASWEDLKNNTKLTSHLLRALGQNYLILRLASRLLGTKFFQTLIFTTCVKRECHKWAVENMWRVSVTCGSSRDITSYNQRTILDHQYSVFTF